MTIRADFDFAVIIPRKVKPQSMTPRNNLYITLFHEKDSRRLVGHVQQVVLVVHAQTTRLQIFVVSGYFTLAGSSFRRTPPNALQLRNRLPGRIDCRNEFVLNELCPHFLYVCRT